MSSQPNNEPDGEECQSKNKRHAQPLGALSYFNNDPPNQNEDKLVDKSTGPTVKCGLREGCIDINNYTRLNRIHEG